MSEASRLKIDDRLELIRFKNGLLKGNIPAASLQNTISQLKSHKSALNTEKIKLVEAFRDGKLEADVAVESISKKEQIDFSIEEYAATKYLQSLNNARRKGLEFNLTLIDVKRLVSRKTCYYTGLPFNNASPELSLSFDRIDNKQGYVRGNVVSCLQSVNALKNELIEKDGAPFKDGLEILIRCVTKWRIPQ